MLETKKILRQDRFRIVHQFGQDGKGATYEAFDNVLKTNVVLKEIEVNLKESANAARAGAQKSAFADEAKILSEIRHESLPQVHDYFSEIDRHFLVLELVDGYSLSEMIEKNDRPFSFAEAADWADQLLDALSYLHRHEPPIIHRAIKPQNIKLMANGKIKLLNLGRTEMIDAKTGESFARQISDSRELPYLPLEQIWDGLDSASRKVILNSYDERSEKILEQPLDARSDIYALGATLYQLLTSRPPVDALARSIDILDENPDPLSSPSEINSSVPKGISDVVMRAMEIKRENRFDSTAIMRQILRAALTQAKKQAETNAPQAAKLAEQNRLEEERQIFEQRKKEIEAEQQRLEQERRLVEQKKQEIEAEKQRQAELLNQQLRESENQRLLAEQRAAVAEQRLLEKEKRAADTDELFELDDTELFEARADKSFPAISASPQDAVKTKFPPQISNAAVTAQAESPAESAVLFSEPQKTNSGFKRIAAVAVILLILGGAIGGWLLLSPKPNAASQTVSEQTNSINEPAKSAPPVETAPVPNTQTATEANNSPVTAASPETSATSETVGTAIDSSTPKNKFAAPNAARVKKEIPPPAKPPAAAQKKAVTVDDIINDN
ncbi:MAG: protein kinase domain-containing protein [Pyrinomonadaceae bacterium]